MALNSRFPFPLYGNCSNCNQERIAPFWCKACEMENFKENFPNWTSDNPDIDEFIRHTQLNASNNADYLEWIEFGQFDLVKNTNKRGAFSSIYSAVWMEGPKWNLDEEADSWNRSGPIKVILKRLDNSQNMSREFLNQLYRYHKCLQSGALVDFFGVTKDPTGCYMFVMKYYENKDLYSYIKESMGVICWRDIIDMLWSISAGLEFIHEHDLAHGHIHGGNILVESEINSIEAKITDTGLHGPIDKQSQQIYYGVVPFIAPEIFDGSMPTKESDIYSFGMIMWMLSSGTPPYNNRPHDKKLVQEIRSGLRPSAVNETPPVFYNLMFQCLDDNPKNRPTASKICEDLGIWVSAICDDPEPSDLSKQFDAAEEVKFSSLEKLDSVSTCHKEAIYFSRSLDFINEYSAAA